MNKYVKKGFCVALATLLIASSFAGCKKINYVTSGAIQAINEIKDGSWQKTDDTDASADDTDNIVIDELTPGTYGGVEFNTLEDVAKFYADAYTYTKSLTAEYINADGQKETFYKLLGDEDIQVGKVMIDGSENAVVNNLVPGIVNSMFQPNVYGLVPCNNRNPKVDNYNETEGDPGKYDFTKSYVTADDILAANVKDNGDGTITMVIQPKAADMSLRGEDSQGRFFEVLGDIGGVVAGIKQVTFTEGDAKDNVKVKYKGGTVTITANAKTKEITSADYEMLVKVQVTHASIAVIKDKSASLDITYKNHFPCSEEYMKEKKQFTKA